MFYGWRKHLPLLTHVSNHLAILFMTCKQVTTVCFVVVIEFLMVNLPQTNWTCFYERLHCAFWKKTCNVTVVVLFENNVETFFLQSTVETHTCDKAHILFRHPQPFVLASLEGIQALNRTLLFSISISVSLSRTVVFYPRVKLSLSSDWPALREGAWLAGACCLKWVWSLEETAHELPHAAYTRRETWRLLFLCFISNAINIFRGENNINEKTVCG